MASCLSVLARLERLDIGFESTRSYPDQNSRHPPPPTRAFLPVFTLLRFEGVCKYLDDLVAWIDAPLLNWLEITFFDQVIEFDTPQLTQFISRTPKFKSHNHNEARLVFSEWDVSVILPQTFGGCLHLAIMWRQPELAVFSLARFCDSSFLQAFIPTVERLYILEDQFLIGMTTSRTTNGWIFYIHLSL
jgi:hypothetical protein